MGGGGIGQNLSYIHIIKDQKILILTLALNDSKIVWESDLTNLIRGKIKKSELNYKINIKTETIAYQKMN